MCQLIHQRFIWRQNLWPWWWPVALLLPIQPMHRRKATTSATTMSSLPTYKCSATKWRVSNGSRWRRKRLSTISVRPRSKAVTSSSTRTAATTCAYAACSRQFTPTITATARMLSIRHFQLISNAYGSPPAYTITTAVTNSCPTSNRRNCAMPWNRLTPENCPLQKGKAWTLCAMKYSLSFSIRQ